MTCSIVLVPAADFKIIFMYRSYRLNHQVYCNVTKMQTCSSIQNISAPPPQLSLSGKTLFNVHCFWRYFAIVILPISEEYYPLTDYTISHVEYVPIRFYRPLHIGKIIL